MEAVKGVKACWNLTQASRFDAQNSTAATVYCDDYFDNVYMNQIRQAQITNLGSLSSTSALQSLMFDTNNAAQQEQDYMEAAWLTEQIGARLIHKRPASR